MCEKPVWKWINLAAFACMVLVNVLAETVPLGGNTTGRISALYPSPITPAPISFSIWGLIYLYLAVFILIQLITKSDNTATEVLGPWFGISCVANIGWVLAWHFHAMSLAMVFMVVLLLSLVIIEGRLRDMQGTLYHRWLVRAPFGIYYGWITVATIANVSVWLSSIGFTGWGLPSQLWQTVVLLAGGVILCAGIWVNRDILYGLAGLWAYVGIMMRQFTLDTTGSNYLWSLSAIIVCCIAMVFVILAVAFECPVQDLPVINRLGSARMKPDGKDWRRES